MKTVLILVLSTNKQCWFGGANCPVTYLDLAKTSLETWDKDPTEGVDTLFHFGRASDHPPRWPVIDPTINCQLLLDEPDGFFDMGRKVLAAMKHSLAHLQFDYVFLANASLYIDKPGLLKYVQDKAETNLALGVCTEGEHAGEKFQFLWGPARLLSRDVVQKVVDHADIWRHEMMEDLALSYLLHAIGVPLDNRGTLASISMDGPRRDIIFYQDGVGGGTSFQGDLTGLPEGLPGLFCFRVKDDKDRANDIKLMKELKAAYVQHGIDQRAV